MKPVKQDALRRWQSRGKDLLSILRSNGLVEGKGEDPRAHEFGLVEELLSCVSGLRQLVAKLEEATATPESYAIFLAREGMDFIHQCHSLQAILEPFHRAYLDLGACIRVIKEDLQSLEITQSGYE